MTTIRDSVLLGAALVFGGISAAQAGDLYDGGYKGSMKDTVMESSASWYLRGDVAWGRHDDPKLIEKGIFDLTSTSMDSTWAVGGGVGRYFTDTIRGDLTYDYRFEADVQGTQLDPWIGAFPGIRKFGLESHVFLANLYYDFNRDGRINPYLGVGLGFTRNKTSGNKAAISGTIADANNTQTYTASFKGDTQTHVAAALMAGFTMKIRDRMHIDAGYRFLYLGEANTGDITGSITTTPVGGVATTAAANGGDPVVEDIVAHEVRVGFRYDIN